MNMKKAVIFALLMCVIAASLFGCGGGEDKIITNIYKSSFLEMPENYSLITSTGISYHNDRLYMHCLELVDEETYEMNHLIYSVDINGENPMTEPYTPMLESSVLFKLHIAEDGSRIAVERTYDVESYANDFYLVKKDAGGSAVFSTLMNDLIPEHPYSLMEAGDINVNTLLTDSDGNIYLLANASVTAFSADGDKLFSIKQADIANGGELQAGTMELIAVNGKPAISYYDAAAQNHLLGYIDTDAMSVADSAVIPSGNLGKNGSFEIFTAPASDDEGCLGYIKTETGLLEFRESGANEVVNWANSDISPNQVHDVYVINKNQIFYVGYDDVRDDSIGVILTRLPDRTADSKNIIEIAYAPAYDEGGYINIADRATAFNQKSDTYKVSIIDYSKSYETSGMSPIEALALDIAAGHIPDGFIFPPYDGYSVIGGKGLLADMYEYMDDDSDLPRSAFLDCVKTPFETDGELHYITGIMTIRLLVGKTENVARYNGWTLEEFLDTADNLESGKTLFTGTRNNIYYSLSPGLVRFIDYENGTCDFANDTFVRFINYLAALPETVDGNDTHTVEYMENYKNDTILLEQDTLWDFSNYFAFMGMFGTQDVTFINYPGVTGGGYAINSLEAYAISAKSEEDIRNGTWEFIKTMFADDYLANAKMMSNTIPPTHSGFKKFMEMMMESYFSVTPNGRTGRSIMPQTPKGAEPESEFVDMRFTQEDADAFLEYLQSGTQKPLDTKISEIIRDELPYVYSGDKTAEEAAEIIQNRVSTYLSETK